MDDIIKKPTHYTQYGVEVIEITRHLPFCLGNMVKYVLRAPYKNGKEDIEKALQYLEWCDGSPVEVPQECYTAINEMSEYILTKFGAISSEINMSTKMFLDNLGKFISGTLPAGVMRTLINYVGDAIDWRTDGMSPQRRVYLAAPYSHEDPAVREMRYRKVTEVAAQLMNRDLCVFSPVTMGHALADKCPEDPNFWARWYLTFLQRWASELHVLKLPGWYKSRGVEREIQCAKRRKLHIFYIEPDTEELCLK